MKRPFHFKKPARTARHPSPVRQCQLVQWDDPRMKERFTADWPDGVPPFNRNWSEVELARWQLGTLPTESSPSRRALELAAAVRDYQNDFFPKLGTYLQETIHYLKPCLPEKN